MNGILTIARLTWLEARRKRIVLAALACGLAFLLVFAAVVYFAPAGRGPIEALQVRIQLQAMALIGLYAVNFLVAAFAVMLPVDTLSGEIASGVMQTLAAKPIRRSDIILGKWLVFCLMSAGYILVMSLGIVGEMWALRGFVQRGLPPALGLMELEACVLVSITMAGGVRLSTVTNGIVAFAFFSLAFIGGWIEQIGVMLGNPSAHYIGTAISLVSPTDALWRLAMHILQPPMMAQIAGNPFSSGSVPSSAMVWWSLAYVAVALLITVGAFRRRPL